MSAAPTEADAFDFFYIERKGKRLYVVGDHAQDVCDELNAGLRVRCGLDNADIHIVQAGEWADLVRDGRTASGATAVAAWSGPYQCDEEPTGELLRAIGTWMRRMLRRR